MSEGQPRSLIDVLDQPAPGFISSCVLLSGLPVALWQFGFAS